jgi:hypothetical protein
MKSVKEPKAIKTPVAAQDVDDEQSEGGESMEPPKNRTKRTHDSGARLTFPAAVQVDAEMTDCTSAASSQVGYHADEVETANTLVEMAGGGSNVR